METREKGGAKVERQRKDKKLQRGMVVMVGKKGGPSTPSPTWRLQFSSLVGNNSNSTYTCNPVHELLHAKTDNVSARKLCASLWEMQPFSLPKIPNKDKAFELRARLDNPTRRDPLRRPAKASPSRRHVNQSPIRRHKSVNKDKHDLKPSSSASCCSSMEEVTPYKPLRTPSCLDLKGKTRESSYSLKTSNELLKVLNRIWGLEDKHSCNMSLLKCLKSEVRHSRSQIKKLLKEKEINRQEMDDLIKQVAGDKIVRKQEQDQMNLVIQTAQEEQENERKLRKHLERLQQKMDLELSEVESALSNSLKELERERRARILLENLCDEFAKGIRDYEQEVRSLRQKADMDYIGREKPDWLVLHISEAWLDERMQMRLAEAQNDCAEKSTVVEKLSLDIETFLERHSNGLRKDGRLVNDALNSWCRRESFPLKETVSAPRDAAEEEDTVDSDSHFEMNKTAGEKLGSRSRRQGNVFTEGDIEETLKGKAGSRETCKGHSLGGLHVRFDQNARNRPMPSEEGDQIHPEVDIGEGFCKGPASPVQKWRSKLASPVFENPEASCQLPGSVGENSLKAKLLEARLEEQKRRSKPSA